MGNTRHVLLLTHLSPLMLSYRWLNEYLSSTAQRGTILCSVRNDRQNHPRSKMAQSLSTWRDVYKCINLIVYQVGKWVASHCTILLDDGNQIEQLLMLNKARCSFTSFLICHAAYCVSIWKQKCALQHFLTQCLITAYINAPIKLIQNVKLDICAPTIAFSSFTYANRLRAVNTIQVATLQRVRLILVFV